MKTEGIAVTSKTSEVDGGVLPESSARTLAGDLALTVKICTSCGKAKTSEHFYKKAGRQDAKCSSCVLIQKKRKRDSKKKRSHKKGNSKVVVVESLIVEAYMGDSLSVPISQVEHCLQGYVLTVLTEARAKEKS